MFEDFNYNLNAGIPITMKGVYLHKITPQSEYQKVLIDCLEDLRNGTYYTLLVSGNTGLGKTYLVQAMANTVIADNMAGDTERAVRYTTHFGLDLKLRSTMANGYKGRSEFEIIEEYKRYKLLIIDEIGRGTATDFMMNRLEYIVCERMARGRKTILITNKTIDELQSVFDRQMQDRLGIMDGGKTENKTSRFLVLNGPSLRGSL